MYTQWHSLSLFFFCLLTAELKMEILRERELRENVEKQMMEDQRMRGKPFYFFSFNLLFFLYLRAFRVSIPRSHFFLTPFNDSILLLKNIETVMRLKLSGSTNIDRALELLPNRCPLPVARVRVCWSWKD